MPRTRPARPDGRRASLSRHLLALGLWPCAAAVIALTGWFTHERLQLLDSGFNAQGQATASQLAALADLSLYAGDTAALQAMAHGVVAARLADRVEISNHAGIFVSTGAAPASARRMRVSSAAVQLARWINLSDYAEPAAGGAAPAPAPAAQPEAETIGTVRVFRSTRAYEEARRGALLGGLLPGLACLLLAAAAARHLARRVSRPLRRLSQAAAELQAGHPGASLSLLDTVAVERPAAELAAFSEQLRQLALGLEGRLQRADDRVRQARADALESIAQVEQASRARARFLASASHDLRQPLHAMGLFIDSLQAAGIPGQRTALQRLQEGTRIMGRLLDDLLDISRLDAQVCTPEPARLRLDALFAQLDALHGPRARELGMALAWRDGGHAVMADPALLLRLLGNLLVNALQHGGGSRVLVAARRARGADGAALVRLEVRDNGRGIAPLHHDSIFEEFFQIANAERDARKGFGLGLSICGRIAQVLGTRVELRSALQRGSTFSLDLPAAPSQPPEAGPPPPAPSLPRLALGLRCLIVDDDVAIRDASVELLRQWSCEVDVAADQQEAGECLADPERRYDAVLCDLQLRGPTDGLAVLEAARRHHPGALHVMISGATAPDILRQLRQAGITLLTKPVAPARLRALLAGCAPAARRR